MIFIKSLLLSILIIFFSNYVLPGIEVNDTTKLPHLGSDFPFAILLGLANALIYPIVHLFNRKSQVLQITAMALFLNFTVYGVSALLQKGIHIDSLSVYFLVSGVVSFSTILVTFFSMKRKVVAEVEIIELPPEDLL